MLFFKKEKKMPYIEHHPISLKDRSKELRECGFGRVPDDVVDTDSLYNYFLSLCSELLEIRFPKGGYGKEQIEEMGKSVLYGALQCKTNEFYWDQYVKMQFPKRPHNILSHLVGLSTYIEKHNIDPLKLFDDFTDQLSKEDFSAVENGEISIDIRDFLRSVNYRDLSYRYFNDIYETFLDRRREREIDEVTRFVDYIQSLDKKERIYYEIGDERSISLTSIIGKSSYEELETVLTENGFGDGSQTAFTLKKLFFERDFPEIMKTYDDQLDFTPYCKSIEQELCGDLSEFSYEGLELSDEDVILFAKTGMDFDEYSDYVDEHPEINPKTEYWILKDRRTTVMYDLNCEFDERIIQKKKYKGR